MSRIILIWPGGRRYDRSDSDVFFCRPDEETIAHAKEMPDGSELRRRGDRRRPRVGWLPPVLLSTGGPGGGPGSNSWIAAVAFYGGLAAAARALRWLRGRIVASHPDECWPEARVPL